MLGILSSLMLFVSMLGGNGGSGASVTASADSAAKSTVRPDFACGADVSWITLMESDGVRFFTPGAGAERREMECMQLLRDYCGVNSIRLRVWVNPKDGWNSISDVVNKAVRAKDLGMRLMIDFHFSDSWADPGQQRLPEAWKDLPFDDLKGAFAAHIAETLTALKDAGVTPEWVQIGNETTPGMMLPMGSLEENPEQLAILISTGHDTAKSIFPDIKTIVHLDCGHDPDRYDRMFDTLSVYDARYDMIGMSIYYFWALEGGYKRGLDDFIADCYSNIDRVKRKYGKPVMICEIGDLYNEPQRAKETISRIMQADVEGVFYWEPEAPCDYNGGYRLGCFDNGAPTVALDAFKIPCRPAE